MSIYAPGSMNRPSRSATGKVRRRAKIRTGAEQTRTFVSRDTIRRAAMMHRDKGNK